MGLQIKNKFISLKQKIIGSFLILILLSSIIIGFYSYYSSKTSTENSVGTTALLIIQSIENTIDIDKFSKLKTKDDMQSEYYKELQTQLSKIRKTTGLKYLYTMRKTDDGKYIYVVDAPPENEDPATLGDEEKDVSDATSSSFEGKEGYEFTSDEWGNLISAYIPIKDQSGKVVGIIGADFDANSMAISLNAYKTNLIIMILAVILIGAIFCYGLSSFLVRSLDKLKVKAELIKNGDLTVKFDKPSNDEIGILSKSFEDMASNLLTLTNEIKNSTENVVYEIDALQKSFNETSKATEEINTVINEVASGSLEQSNSIDEVSSSMDEVFHQVKKSVDYANIVTSSSNKALYSTRQAMDIFKTSIDKVVIVNKTVENTASIIEELGKKSSEISAFSETISQITKQTNMLSLNASIEAARAGEQGKGFAVVAGEIQLLAERSNVASKQISEITSTMQREIDSAISAIANGVIQANEGVTAVTKVDGYLAELENSSYEANSNVTEIIEAINLIESICRHTVNKIHSLTDISKNFSAGSQHAAAATEEQSAIMEQITENLDIIRQGSQKLNGVVHKFKID